MSDASPDELDELLGQRARAREQAELSARAPEWEAVARGELELDAAIAEREAAGDGEVERAAAYFRPFDASETTALVDGLLGQLAPNPLRSTNDDFTADDNVILLPDAASKPAKPSAIEVHDPSTSRSWWIPGGMLAAAAAAIVVWWIWPPNEDVRGSSDSGQLIAQRDPLPSYALETDGGLKPLRDSGGDAGEADGVLRYRRATAFEWVLRPESEAGEVGARGFAFVDGGSAGLPLDLAATVAIAESGAIRIRGEIAQLGLEPGRYTIALVVGRPGALPEQAAEVASGASDAWAVHRVEIEILD